MNPKRELYRNVSVVDRFFWNKDGKKGKKIKEN